jgi:nucleoside-diphosphate-sugar epimerase
MTAPQMNSAKRKNSLNILVTGATGFIGRQLVPTLLQKGYTVSCLARSTSRRPDNFTDSVHWVLGDLLDKQSLVEACGGVDAVVHLGGAIKASDAKMFFSINVDGTRNILEALVQAGNPHARFIYFSSQAALGPAPTPKPLTEESKSHPVSAYGQSKFQAEQIVQEYNKQLCCVILRPSVVYGPGDRESLAFFKIAKYHINPIIGFKPKYIDIIHVEDLVQIVLSVLKEDIKSGEIFNINDGQNGGYSVNAVVRHAAEALKTWTAPVYIPLPVLKIAAILSGTLSKISGRSAMFNSDKYREIAAQYWLFCSEKVSATLGYTPKYNIENGFLTTALWYKKHKWL